MFLYTVSFSNMPVEYPKSASLGGGEVNRAGHGAKPLPLVLWSSKKNPKKSSVGIQFDIPYLISEEIYAVIEKRGEAYGHCKM